MEREGTRELESHCKQSSADEGHSVGCWRDWRVVRAAVGLCEQQALSVPKSLAAASSIRAVPDRRSHAVGRRWSDPVNGGDDGGWRLASSWQPFSRGGHIGGLAPGGAAAKPGGRTRRSPRKPTYRNHSRRPACCGVGGGRSNAEAATDTQWTLQLAAVAVAGGGPLGGWDAGCRPDRSCYQGRGGSPSPCNGRRHSACRSALQEMGLPDYAGCIDVAIPTGCQRSGPRGAHDGQPLNASVLELAAR